MSLSRSALWLLAGGMLVLVGRVSFLSRAIQRNATVVDVSRAIRVSDNTGVCPTLEIVGRHDEFVTIVSHEDQRIAVLFGLLTIARADVFQSKLILSDALVNHIERPSDQFWYGCAAFQAGKIDDAVNAWRAAGALNYFLVRGYNALVRDEINKALALYQIAAQIAPDSSKAWLGTAASLQLLALNRQAQWEDMLQAAERALMLAPDEPQAHYLVGYGLWYIKRDPPRAERELRWALEHRNDWLDAYVLGSFLLDQGRTGEPTQLLQRAVLIQDIPMVRGQLVRAYLAEGRCADAQHEYMMALQRFPETEKGLLAICQSYPKCDCR